MTKTETMDEKSLDEIISESEKRFDRLNKKAYRLMNGIKANGHPRTTRKTILDVLACVPDGSVILGVLMQADIWAESLNKTEYLTLPSGQWVIEFDWIRHVYQQRGYEAFQDAVDAMRRLINDDFDKAKELSEYAGLEDEFKPIYEYYAPKR
jgi:hypothetical protein